MEQPDLMSIVKRSLSLDARIEVPASWDEYEHVQEFLDNLGTKYPRLWYDSTRQIATVVAAPTPLHGYIAGDLVTSLANCCDRIMERGGVSEDIRRRVSAATDVTQYSEAAHGLTIREWDGALGYLGDDKEMKSMVAFEVGVSQSYRSLQEAISWCVCALHCHLGISMCLNEGPRGARPAIKYYANKQQVEEAVQQANYELSVQLQHNPYGPLVRNGVTWFGMLEQVIIETFRCEDENCPPDTLLNPTQSFVFIRDGQSWPEDIPPNLREVVLSDCVPSYVLSGHEILESPVNFFQKSWVEEKISSLILETAVKRFRKKCVARRTT